MNTMQGGIRWGAAPVNWNNDDLPEWGFRVPVDQVLQEAAAAGCEGIEWGTGFPEDGEEVRDLLARHGLHLCGAYQWVRLHEVPVAVELPRLQPVMSRLQRGGARHLVVAVQWTPERRAYAGRAAQAPSLPAQGWRRLTDGLVHLGRVAADYGLQLVYHNHVGTYVETPEELERLLQDTDPDWVGWCLDTGHLAWGAGDPAAPVELARRHAGRIRYVHAKDVDVGAMRAVVAAGGGFLDGLREGVFVPPGEGSVDFRAILATLSEAGYSGWVVEEAEQDPNRFSARVQVQRGLRHLRQALVGGEG